MPPTEDSPTDDEIADLMNESDGDAGEENAGAGVEVGVPPALDDEDSIMSTEEETFSMNDFDSELSSETTSSPESVADSGTEAEVGESIETSGVESDSNSMNDQQTVDTISSAKSTSSSSNGKGDVSEFRKTLASLSRQVEIDKLAFLHKSLLENGEELPSLNDIADDIQGKKALFPAGDFDFYSKRPSARLDGWISGLSFGVSRRAKKFTK